MKKYFVYLLMALSALFFNACSDDDPDQDPGDDTSGGSTVILGDSSILVVYFSHTNTTQAIAQRIAELTEGTLFRIETVNPYPTNYTECTEVAKEELDRGVRPQLKDVVEDMDQYDTIFVGCPVWWHTAPMAIWSFLESKDYDFKGKTIVPFCTYAATYRDETLAKIVELTPVSRHLKGYGAVDRDTKGVEAWLKEIKVLN